MTLVIAIREKFSDENFSAAKIFRRKIFLAGCEMLAPTLHFARLTLGAASPDHAEAFIAFRVTEASRDRRAEPELCRVIRPAHPGGQA